MSKLAFGRLAPTLALLVVQEGLAQQLHVVGTEPQRHALTAPDAAPVRIEFDRALDPLTVPPSAATVTLFGKVSGVAAGTFTLENAGRTLRFDPASPFEAGEEVVVVVARSVAAADGSPMRSAGFAYTFRVASAPAALVFVENQELTTRTPQHPFTRVYGGQGCDVDGDGTPDLCIINENTNDVRVFLNENTGHGTFANFLAPPSVVGNTPSPNDNADLNGDRHIDLVTANTTSNTVSVLMGIGDGTFQPAQHYVVGATPRGLALFDVDGDGDTDIVAGALGGNHVTVLRNDGAGQFGSPSTFDGGPSEYGLAAADFDNDGIMDLAVSAAGEQRIRVYRGNGDGTFTFSSSSPSGGVGWMLACGDVNGDGDMDVTTANGGTNNVAFLLGNGLGQLSAPTIFATPGLTTATDVGDLDGDGDLDWVISSFGGGVWELRENDGLGNFTLRTTFQAAANPACVIVLDIDGDRDLDFVLLDEIADLLTVMENTAPAESFCAGETACPCGNDAAAGSGTGCVNVTGLGGLLRSTGSSSVSLDDLRLEATQLSPVTFGLVFMGPTSSVATPMGAGLRCASGSLVRFAAGGTGAAGTHVEGPGLIAATQPLGPAHAINVGETWAFQVWYRDSLGACPVYNVTNALRITFRP
jgi:hypothetical protein